MDNAPPFARCCALAACRRFLREEDGQDILEYALLTAAIGLAGLAVMNAMGVSLSTAYVGWNTEIEKLWLPDEAAKKSS